MKNVPKYIVIHCTAYSEAKMFDQLLAVNQWHKDRDFPLSTLGWYVGYHRLITGGKNYQCRKDDEVGAHCNQGIDANLNPIQGPASGTSMNFKSLGICAGFDGDIEHMSIQHYALLQKQVWDWQDQYGIPNSNIFFHRHFATNKTCPGNLYDQAWIEKLLERPKPVPMPETCSAEREVIADQSKKLGLYAVLVKALRSLLDNF